MPTFECEARRVIVYDFKIEAPSREEAAKKLKAILKEDRDGDSFDLRDCYLYPSGCSLDYIATAKIK